MGIEVCVKAASGAPDVLGDCPFSQRKGSSHLRGEDPYKTHLINTSLIPHWFLAISPEVKFSLVKLDNDENWVDNSDAIVGIIEEKYPECSFVAVSPEFASVGSNIIGDFITFLKS